MSRTYMDLFERLDHLQSATVGVLDVNIVYKKPFSSTKEGSMYSSFDDLHMRSNNSSDSNSFGFNSWDSDDDSSNEGGGSCTSSASDVNTHQSHETSEEDSAGEKNEDVATGSQSTEKVVEHMGAESAEEDAVAMTTNKTTAEKDLVSVGDVSNHERVESRAETVSNAGGEARCKEGEGVQKVDSVVDDHRTEKTESARTSPLQDVSQMGEICDQGVIDKESSQLDEHVNSESVVGDSCQASLATTPIKNGENAGSSSCPVASSEGEEESSDEEVEDEEGSSGEDSLDASHNQYNKRDQSRLFKMVKRKFFSILPKTKLTLYRVSEYDSDNETEMFYISRKEERYTIPDV